MLSSATARPSAARVSQLTVVFDHIVNFVGAPESAFMLQKIFNGIPIGNVGFTVSLTVVDGATVATISFTSDTEFGCPWSMADID